MRTLLGYISYDPIVRIRIGPLSLSPHGIGIYLGFLAGAFGFLIPGLRKRGVPDDLSYAMLFRALLGAIVGARVAYVVNHYGEFANPVEYLQVWRGGLSLLGGITGAIVFNIRFWRKHGLGFWPVMDTAVPGLALGLIIGRIGDLVIADHLGKQTTFFLGYRCPTPAIVGETVGSPCDPGTIVHSTALYDLISVCGLFALLLVLRRREHYQGFLTAVFGLWYGTSRVIEDFLRVDKQILGLTGSQWTALFVLIYCAYVLFYLKKTPSWGMGQMTSDGRYGVEPIAEIVEGDIGDNKPEESEAEDETEPAENSGRADSG